MVKQFVRGVCVAMALAGGWAGAQVTLNGAGASFPAPMYNKFIEEYSRIKPDVKVNYKSVGSGAGIKALSEGTVDFGGTDSPMKDEQIRKASGGHIVHIPTVMGGVVPIYNVPGVTKPLNFTGPVLADIFLGKITKWNDAKIADHNSGVTLPDLAITVVHRSDGSGTTAIFTDYLSKVSPEWKGGPGKGSSVKWPAASSVGAPQNDGVANTVKEVKGAVGYVEVIYAASNNIAFGAVQNKAGKFVTASMESISAAAGALKQVPDDLRISITDSEGEQAYPISGLTWIIAYQNQKDAEKGKALVDFVNWITGDGQTLAPALYYAPLPQSLLPKVQAQIKSIKVGQ